jgi:hypothetical protein
MSVKENSLKRAPSEQKRRGKKLDRLQDRQRERFDAILTWFAQLDEDTYEPVEITWREPEIIDQ